MRSFRRWFGLAGVLLAATVSGAAQAETWQHCANEGEICRVSSDARVRYGADGKYVYLQANQALSCTTGQFGSDPVRGVRKQCEVEVLSNKDRLLRGLGLSAVPQSANSGWVNCATEGQVCQVPGRGTVRYGDGQQFVFVETNGGAVTCDTRAMGRDPAYGKVKHCDYMLNAPAAPAAALSQPGWTLCAGEGQICNVPGRGTVRFGDGLQFVSMETQGGRVNCDVRSMGRDPSVGRVKRCEYMLASQAVATTTGAVAGGVARTGPIRVLTDSPMGPFPQSYQDATGTWDYCASEGGTCLYDGRKTVRYGTLDQWVELRDATYLKCQAASFGVPANPQEIRACYVRQ